MRGVVSCPCGATQIPIVEIEAMTVHEIEQAEQRFDDCAACRRRKKDRAATWLAIGMSGLFAWHLPAMLDLAGGWIR